MEVIIKGDRKVEEAKKEAERMAERNWERIHSQPKPTKDLSGLTFEQIQKILQGGDR